MHLNTEERAYWNKEVAVMLQIGESTLRKWCLELEKNGYTFIRGYKDSRAFLQHDLDALNYYKKLTKDGHYKMEQAASMVVEKYLHRKGEQEGTASVPVEKAHTESSLQDMNENIDELIKISREQLNVMKEQLEISRDMNKELLESIRIRDRIIEQQAQKIMIDYERTDDSASKEQVNVSEERSSYDQIEKVEEEEVPKKKGLIKRIRNLFKK